VAEALTARNLGLNFLPSVTRDKNFGHLQLRDRTNIPHDAVLTKYQKSTSATRTSSAHALFGPNRCRAILNLLRICKTPSAGTYIYAYIYLCISLGPDWTPNYSTRQLHSTVNVDGQHTVRVQSSDFAQPFFRTEVTEVTEHTATTVSARNMPQWPIGLASLNHRAP